MTGAVLAGGASRRMGTNKAFIRVGGMAMVEHVAGVLSRVFDEVLLIADDVDLYGGLGLRVCPDAYTGAGSLGGVYTAIVRAASDEVFVAACDMPGLDEAAVRRVAGEPLDGALAVVPLIDGRLHPLHARYARACAPIMEDMIRRGELRLADFLRRIGPRTLTAEDFGEIDIRASVANVNTVEELRQVRSGGAGPAEEG